MDATLQELFIRNQKCNNVDDDEDATIVMIPMLRRRHNKGKTKWENYRKQIVEEPGFKNVKNKHLGMSHF